MADDQKKAGHVDKAEHEAMFKFYSEHRSLQAVANEFKRSYTAVQRQAKGGRIVNGRHSFEAWEPRLARIDKKVSDKTDADIEASLSDMIEWIDLMLVKGAAEILDSDTEMAVKDFLGLVEAKLKLAGLDLGEAKDKSSLQSLLAELITMREQSPDEYDRTVKNVLAGFGDFSAKTRDQLSSL